MSERMPSTFRPDYSPHSIVLSKMSMIIIVAEQYMNVILGENTDVLIEVLLIIG